EVIGQTQEERDVLSAGEIAALLEEPDPEGTGVPESSEAMDDDELAALLAEAQAVEASDIDTGSMMQPTASVAETKEVEVPVEEPVALTIAPKEVKQPDKV